MTPPVRIPFEAFDRGSIDRLEEKLEIARLVAAGVKSGDVIGAGSGSTAFLAVHAIAERVAAGELTGVSLIPTSHEVHLTIAGLVPSTPGLVVGDLSSGFPDWLFDGADEVDPDGNLIKGRGGALFREKIMFQATEDRRILIDESKHVTRLGDRFPIPVEVVPLAMPVVLAALEELGAVEAAVRSGTGKDGPVITETGNFLVDCRFGAITPGLERRIKEIPGVVESGLLQGYGPTLITT